MPESGRHKLMQQEQPPVTGHGTGCVPLCCSYVPLARFDTVAATAAERMLAAIFYGETARSTHSPSGLVIPVAMAQMGDEPLVELWTSDLPLQHGERDGIKFASNEDVLFGYVAPILAPDGDLDTLTHDVYQRILRLVSTLDYPHMLRMWNYLPDINSYSNGIEHYVSFCMGRHRALEAFETGFERSLPAASALGYHSSPVTVYFIASRTAGEQIENPRQVNAYCYPPQYGPKSPSFSRSKLVRWKHGADFFISGTASIVGHASRHVDDVSAQLEETLRNVEALAGCLQAKGVKGVTGIRDLSLLKVYIRHRADYPRVKSILDARIEGAVPLMYLEADVCRADLLLEIEGLYSTATPPY